MATSRFALNSKVQQFLQPSAASTEVALIGPMLGAVPRWPNCPLVFVDGGAKWRDDLPPQFNWPTLSLGDGDSLGNTRLDVLLNTDKAISDLGYALELLSALNISRLYLLGFLGGRRDHEWINFGVVANFLADRQQLRADFDNAVSLLAPGEYRFKHSGGFSLVHFSDAQTSIRGAVKYPLEQAHLPAHSSFGLSNQAQGEFQIASDKVSLCFFQPGLPAT